MLALTDPYKVLQVDPEAEPEVIRAAYRALALKYHPDVATGSQDRMAALNQAWTILRDAATRAAYDEARRAAKRAAANRRLDGRQPEVSYAMRAPMPATPPGKPSGSVLDFGRYAGWSLGQVAACDAEYLEWLARTPIGRSFHREIREILARRDAAAAGMSPPTADRRPGRLGRN
jgi:curved DNA-binding protein CbpA